MVFNKATEYALRISLFLAKQKSGCAIGANSIQTEELIPKRFLFKIMLGLSKAGIVKSIRGRKGGFMLGRNPEDISLYNIIEAIEGPVVLNHCLVDPSKCEKSAAEYCIVNKILGGLREELVYKFQSINMKMLI